jgi:hypothetical protein
MKFLKLFFGIIFNKLLGASDTPVMAGLDI